MSDLPETRGCKSLVAKETQEQVGDRSKEAERAEARDRVENEREVGVKGRCRVGNGKSGVDPLEEEV